MEDADSSSGLEVNREQEASCLQIDNEANRLSDEFRKESGKISKRATLPPKALAKLLSSSASWLQAFPRLADTSLQSLALFSYASPSVSSLLRLL